MRCLISGSVQPFLEALRGYEVIGLTSTPALRRLMARAIPRAERDSSAREEVADGG